MSGGGRDTRLEYDIELPEEAPDVEAYALYAYLSSLLGEIVDALDSGA